METDNLRGIRPEDGSPDGPGGSPQPADAASDETVSIADFDNVIPIGEFDDALDVEVLDHSKDPGYVRQKITEELENIQALKPLWSDYEKESWTRLLNDKWFKSLISQPRIMLAVLQCPPHYLYKLKSTGHHVFIESYEISKKGYKDRYLQGEIGVTLKLEQNWNQDLLYERKIVFCPLRDLERIAHRQAAVNERLVSHGVS